MDGKRRINPQNPPRVIRGRKQKKAVSPRSEVVVHSVPTAVTPTRTAVVPAENEEGV